VSGFGRSVLIAILLAGGLGIAQLRAQAVLGDPRDAPKIFAANCSACHKGPQGLAKSGQVAGFLRQHYTTSPEMSAAMAAYLVAAGNAPAKKEKGPATAETPAASTKSKSKKGEQLAAQPQNERNSEPIAQQTPRGKQRQAKGHEQAATQTIMEEPKPDPRPAHAETKQAAATPAPSQSAASLLAAPAAVTPMPVAPTPTVTLDIPLPPLPDAPPPELSQSVFSSSPLP
jgi:hypothetical protein